MKTDALVRLINDYISCAKYMCNAVRDEYAIGNHLLLGAYREKKIPKEGKLAGEISFNFHGGGCYFEFDIGTIDIDFGPDGRCDGFDQYRVYDFLKTSEVRSMHYRELILEEDFKDAFEGLIQRKIISSPGWYPNPGLYYLKENIAN
jgi:hypothetical protein